jgi:hypothetical protein
VVLAALEQLVAAEQLVTGAGGLATTVGAVSTDTCNGESLGCGTGVTLQQWLSFASGLLPDHGCPVLGLREHWPHMIREAWGRVARVPPVSPAHHDAQASWLIRPCAS